MMSLLHGCGQKTRTPESQRTCSSQREDHVCAGSPDLPEGLGWVLHGQCFASELMNTSSGATSVERACSLFRKETAPHPSLTERVYNFNALRL